MGKIWKDKKHERSKETCVIAYQPPQEYLRRTVTIEHRKAITREEIR